MVVECAPQCAQWAVKAFGECVCNGSDLASVIFGLTSVVAMALCFLPQIVINWLSQSSEGMSFGLILIWTVGDIFNIVGVLLSKALPTQVYLAFLYSGVDVVLNIQHIWYNYLKKSSWRNKVAAWLEPAKVMDLSDGASNATNIEAGNVTLAFELVDTSSKSAPTAEKSSNLLPLGLVLLSVSCVVPFSATAASNMGILSLPGSSAYLSSAFKPFEEMPTARFTPSRVLLGAETQVLMGTVLGWAMAACFVMGRIPQLLQNFKRHTTEGLSGMMMVLLVFGNISYLLSIFLRSTAWSFVGPKLPWIISSSGSLTLDSMILGQVIYYRRKQCNMRRRAAALQDAFEVVVRTAGQSHELG